MSRPRGLHTSTPLKITFPVISAPDCQRPFSQSGHGRSHQPFSPGRTGRCSTWRLPEGPQDCVRGSSLPQPPTGHPVHGQPRAFWGPSKPDLCSRTSAGLPQHHTHRHTGLQHPGPRSRHVHLLPCTAWQVPALPATLIKDRHLCRPPPCSGTGSVLTRASSSLQDSFCVSGWLSRTLGPEVGHKTNAGGLPGEAGHHGTGLRS